MGSSALSVLAHLLLKRVGEAKPEPRLDATRRALELLGSPHLRIPVVHVTGTNGKTSTSRMIESILRKSGLRTGLFTSPHISRLNERFVVDGEPVSDELLIRAWGSVEPAVRAADEEFRARGRTALTYFEVLTVIGFSVFAEAGVDVCVLEVGMGGEWDSTNVAIARVAVFTPISLDQAAELGSTVAEIAHTKAGIIKPGCTVVTAIQPESALAELRLAAEGKGARLLIQASDFEVESDRPTAAGRLLSIRTPAGLHDGLELGLRGAHQSQNAAVAVAAAEAYLAMSGRPVTEKAIAQGLAAATSPGRLQHVSEQPPVVVDAAHNPAGAESLARALRDSFDFSYIVLVLSILAEKDVAGILAELSGVVSEVVVTWSGSDRAIPAEELAEIVRDVLSVEVHVEPDVDRAIELAKRIAVGRQDGAVVVTGSISLLAAAATAATRVS